MNFTTMFNLNVISVVRLLGNNENRMKFAIAQKTPEKPELYDSKYHIVFEIVHCSHHCRKSPHYVFHSLKVFDNTVNSA